MHRCHELSVDEHGLLLAAVNDLGFKRFRLMSYWNIHEAERGIYNFDELDWQVDLLARSGCKISMCVGKRQPRWPECHIPEWALKLTPRDWYESLYKYIEVVVSRYENNPAIVSWQLENEALLKSFGICPDGDYQSSRLNCELKIIKNISKLPVIMTLSDSWGLPWRTPKPDTYAMSLYLQTVRKNSQPVYSRRSPGFYKIRARLIKLLRNRPVFIHELQAEPWLSQPITDAPYSQQIQLMDSEQLLRNIDFAKETALAPIDLWGLEWWYWLREKHYNSTLWDAVRSLLSEP